MIKNSMVQGFFAALCLVAFSGMYHTALAEDANAAPEFPYMTGDLGGVRSALVKKGIDIQAAYVGDVLDNVSGGTSRGATYMDNLDVTVDIDGSKLYGLEGSRIFVDALYNGGGSFNDRHVGSYEGIDNIEVATQTFKIFEAWIEQNFWGDAVSVRAGLYDLNSEFDVTDSSGIFLNPTYGIDTAYAATGRNGPSIFPTTSMAVRVKLVPMDKSYLMFSVLDGVPGDPNNGHGTQVEFNHGDGVLVAAEGGYGDLAGGRVGVGGWWYSAKSDNLFATDDLGNPLRQRGHGTYAVAEMTLFSPGGDAARHVDGFIRFAHSDDDVTQFNISGSAGLVYNGPFESRKDDIAGITVHGAHNGKPFRDAAALSGASAKAGEWGVEATYSAQLTPWLSIQPDVQYIRDPGTVAEIDHATIIGTRVKINF